jgi:hypothetical protein
MLDLVRSRYRNAGIAIFLLSGLIGCGDAKSFSDLSSAIESPKAKSKPQNEDALAEAKAPVVATKPQTPSRDMSEDQTPIIASKKSVTLSDEEEKEEEELAASLALNQNEAIESNTLQDE